MDHNCTPFSNTGTVCALVWFRLRMRIMLKSCDIHCRCSVSPEITHLNFYLYANFFLSLTFAQYQKYYQDEYRAAE